VKKKSWAVIGRGIIGLTTAFRLLQAGYQVTLIGPSNRKGIASLAALGNFTAKGLLINDGSFAAVKLLGQSYLRRLVDDVESEVGNIIPKITGVFEVFQSQDDLARLRKRIYHNNFSSLLSFEILNSRQTNEKSHFLREYGNILENGGSLYYPDDFWVDPESLLTGLESAITKLGGFFIDRTVENIRPHSKGEIALSFSDHGIVANEVLVAAGVATNQILARASLFCFPLQESPGITIDVPASPNFSEAITVGRKGLRVWNSSIRFGSYDAEVELIDSTAIKTMDENGLISQIVNKAMNETALPRSIVQIKGSRSYTKDRLPIFGSFPAFSGFPELRIWLATAFHKTGFYLADFCGKNLIATLRNRPVHPLFNELSPRRFSG
jgi:glycine/D-amino acid oxidase-like deaminating enzyme